MKNYITFTYAGSCSSDFNIIVRSVNNLTGPERNILIEEVYGNDTPLLIDKKNFKPLYLEFDCVLDVQDNNINDLASQIRMWLQDNISFDKLEISTDEDCYYEAVCFNKLDIKEIIEILGEFKITFLCKPLKKVISGDDPIIIKNNDKVFNPNYSSKPLIKIVGSGDITLNINNDNVHFKSVESEIIIDCEIEEAYTLKDGLINFCNDKMYSEFPNLKHGVNRFSWLGNVEYLEVIPRWEVL